MSSQSKGHPPAVPGAHPAQGAGREGRPEHGVLGEEVVHVPKGKNRLQYVFMIAMLVFLTVIYLVPGAILSTFRNSGDADYLSFESPSGKQTVLRHSEFQKRRNGFADVLEIFDILKYFVGVGQERNLSDESAARLIVLDELTQEAGIEIADDELAQFLTEMRVDRDTWLAVTDRYGGPGHIEPNLKRLLAIRRYLDLVTQVARIPDIKAIEKRWADEHVEVSYEYVELPSESFEAEAKTTAPDDAALEAWFAERPEFERTQLMQEARYKATFAVFRDGASTPAAGLLARYPDTSGEAPEVRAQGYYDQVFFSRFARPKPADEPAPEPGQEPPTPYLAFEEVKDRALAEAPVYFAMQAWSADIAQRVAAGEQVDLAAEATDLGLAVARLEDPATLEDLRKLEGLGEFAVGPVANLQPGQISPRVIADAQGIVIARLDEKLEPSLPPFAEIRDKVLASWSKDRAADLALERLKALRAGFEAAPPAPEEEEAPPEDPQAPEEEKPERKQATSEAFRAAVEGAGYTVSVRPWLDKSGAPTEDPDAATTAHAFLAQHVEYADNDEGFVPPPELDRQRAHAYLVRVAGKRPIDIARMTPQVYNAYKGASSAEPANQVRTYLTGPDLDARYGITFLVKKQVEPDEGETEGAGDAGGAGTAGDARE
jgi:hypothetical protein